MRRLLVLFALTLPAAAKAQSKIPFGTDRQPATYAEAKATIEKTIRAHPREFPLRMQAAEFYMNSGDNLSAIPHLMAATKLTSRVFPWIGLGDAATLTRKFPLAHEAYDHAMKIDPNNSLLMRGRGQLLIAEHRFSEARRLLEAGVKRYPDNTNLRAALGNLYIVLNKPRLAIDVLEPAVKKEPTRADRHALLGEAYERDLHMEAAIREMQEAVRLDPSLSEAWGRLGLYLINLTRYQEAREPLQQAISLEPGESHYYWALGDSWLLESPDENHFQKAIQFYQQALNLDPRNDKALYSFGMALSRHARPEDAPKAVEMFTRLLKLHPTDMNAHYKLYELYRKLGRPKEAEYHRLEFKKYFGKGRNQIRGLYATSAFHDTPEVHVKFGRQAMAAKNYRLAAQEFGFALERNRNLTAARQGLLEAQHKMGLSAKAGTP